MSKFPPSCGLVSSTISIRERISPIVSDALLCVPEPPPVTKPTKESATVNAAEPISFKSKVISGVLVPLATSKPTPTVNSVTVPVLAVAPSATFNADCI